MRRNAVLFVLISVLSGFGSTALTISASIRVLDLSGSVSLAALTSLFLYAPLLPLCPAPEISPGDQRLRAARR